MGAYLRYDFADWSSPAANIRSQHEFVELASMAFCVCPGPKDIALISFAMRVIGDVVQNLAIRVFDLLDVVVAHSSDQTPGLRD